MANKLEKIVPEDIFESGDLKILICYMLTSLGEPLPATELSQLFHYEGIANYFDTQTAIDNLLNGGYIKETSKDMFLATEKGADLAETLKQSVALTVRERAIKVVARMMARRRHEKETDIEITKTERGYNVSLNIIEGDSSLLQLSLKVADEISANFIKERILEDPSYVYAGLIELLLDEDINYKK